MIVKKVPQDDVHAMFKDALDVEKDFIIVSIPCAMLGMNATLMTEYIQFVADRLIAQLGYDKMYNIKNPFDFMELMSLPGKTNFFEKRVSEYSLASGGNRDEAFNFSEDTLF